jgi:hypothetical protein
MLKHALPRSILQSTLLFPPTRLRLADEPDNDLGDNDDDDFDEEDEDEEDEEPEDEDEEEWQVGTRRHAN